MSLINDALRDLDARDSLALGQPSNTEKPAPSSAEERAYVKAKRRAMAWPHQFFAGVLLCSAVSAAIYLLPHNETEKVSVNAGLSNLALTQVPKIDQALTSVPAPSVEFPTQKKPPLAGNVEKYLALAEAAIVHNQLSVPLNANAIYYLHAVLGLDPDNLRAKENLLKIKQLYIQQVEYAIDRKNIARAKVLVGRGNNFGLSNAELKAYHDKISSVEFTLADAAPLLPEIQKKTHNENLSEVAKPSWIKVTSASEDLRYMTKLKHRIANGDMNAVLADLEIYSENSPQSLNAKIFLFELYVEKSDFASAQFLLSALPNGHIASAYFSAQLLNHFKGPEQAILVLESSPPDRLMREKQWSYLAALYQKEKHYQKAQNLYTALLRIDETHPQYLLGFAIAADVRGERFRSLQAYKKLLFSGHANVKVQRFVEQRVKTLSAQEQTEASAW